MTISDLIRDAIEDFRGRNSGRDPIVLKLGRKQIAGLDSFVSRYGGGAVPERERVGVPNFDGIPIEQVDADSWLAAEGDGNSD